MPFTAGIFRPQASPTYCAVLSRQGGGGHSAAGTPGTRSSFSKSRCRHPVINLYNVLTEVPTWPASQSNEVICPSSQWAHCLHRAQPSGGPDAQHRCWTMQAKHPALHLCANLRRRLSTSHTFDTVKTRQTNARFHALPNQYGVRAQAARHRCHPPSGSSSRRFRAPYLPPWMGQHHVQTLTAAAPVGLLPAAGPAQAWGWGTQASRLFQDAGLCPATGRAMGERRSPIDGPPGWHKGY